MSASYCYRPFENSGPLETNMKNLIYFIFFVFPVCLFCEVSDAPDTSAREYSNRSPLTKPVSAVTAKAHLTSASNGAKTLFPLSSFVAKAHHASVLLSWGIPRHAGPVNFIIERAPEGSDWEKVGAVKATKGQQEYSFWDVRVQPGATYQYRLVHQANGGRIQFSRPVFLRVDSSLDEYMLIFGLIGFIGYLAYEARQLVK